LQIGEILTWAETSTKAIASEIQQSHCTFQITINKHDKCIYSKVIDNDYLIFCLYIDAVGNS